MEEIKPIKLVKDGVTHTVTDETFIRALRNEGFKTEEELAQEQPHEQPQEETAEETTEEETEQPEEVTEIE